MTGAGGRPSLGILGGGQLGRMLALAGHDLGVRSVCLDPDPDASCGQVADQVVGGLADLEAAGRLADRVERVTFEFEAVPAATLAWVAERRPVFPPVGALRITQDRLSEKRLCEALDLPVAAYAAVGRPGDLPEAIRRVGLPARLKARRLGYDGRGQAVVEQPRDAAAAWAAVGAVPAILERVVPFARELSVLAVRDPAGSTVCYPLVENRHHQGILRLSLAPAPGLTPQIQAQGEALAVRLLEALDHVGVLAVECFEIEDRLLVNELAPRVHNSGHWTIEGAATSQFENHLRAGLGWPLGPTEMRGLAALVNCIGEAVDPRRVLRHPGCHLHWYGKTVRPGRKLGHVTVLAQDPQALSERVRAVTEAVTIPSAVLRRPLIDSPRRVDPPEPTA
ncbi:MAG TPA: 5-(carboxyamino)imidazole ribonucleotide synthase [Candidatus Micrarchaeia archaeon]|nr:5-(carboxyamino)imidazole ribonucleotide synthase [Candidatus Micrarchaeia archaeon]